MDTTLLKPENKDIPATTTGREINSGVPAYREPAIETPQRPLRMRLNPPIEYDGKSYNELAFDFDRLIVKDFQNNEHTFCILAAQVADVPVGLIKKLPRRYYMPLRLEVLKACGSEEEND